MKPLTAEFILWGVWYASWMVAAVWSSRATGRPKASAMVPNLVITTLGAGLLFAPQGSFWRLWRTPETLAWVLVVVTALAFAFCWWARAHLGRMWSGYVSMKEDHRLIDTGPYRLTRHPIYTGIIAAAIALATLKGAGAALAGAALVALGLTLKARLEESFLKQSLGAAPYGAYAVRTPMLIPRPWRSR